MPLIYSWLEPDQSSMALIEIGQPSGFFTDLVGVVSEPPYKRVELASKKVVLYFDEVMLNYTYLFVLFNHISYALILYKMLFYKAIIAIMYIQ